LNQNFNPAREGILASITDVIFELNKLYNFVIKEIDSNEEKNLKILQDFEKEILEKSNDLQQNLPSSWSEEMQIFTVNLESYLSDMVSTDLLQPNELEKLIKEKVKLEISQTDDFSYLLAD
jgi:predicted nucleotidyltransferase